MVACPAMSASEDAGAPASPADEAAPPAELRVRLVAALLAAAGPQEGELLLVQHDPQASLLLVPDKGQRIHVFSADEGAPPAPLRAQLAAVVKASNQTGIEAHFVIAGGSEGARAALKEAIPRLQSGALGFHHVGSSGHVEQLGRKGLPLLERAAGEVTSTEPLDPAALAAELARGEAFLQKEQEIAGKLGGSYRVTAAITVACVALMGLAYLWSGGPLSVVLYRMGAVSGPAVKNGELWRLFGGAFLHGDVIHLVLNMFALWSFGTLLEAVLGGRRYLVLYALSALGGSLASAFLRPEGMSVGASGAVWGLMAGGIGLALRPRGLLPPSIVAQMRQRAWPPLAINFFYSFQPGIDILAHIGGGLVGFALVASVLTHGLKPIEARRSPSDAEAAPGPGTLAGAVLAAAVMALSVAVSLANGRPWEYRAAPVLARTPIGETGLSIELPTATLTPTTFEQVPPSISVFTFGKLPDAPVAFEILVAPLSGELTPEELEALLQEEGKQLEANPPGKFKRTKAAARVTIGSRPAVLVEHEQENLLLRSYVVVIGDREVVVRGYALKDRPAAWNNVEQAVAASIAKN